MPDSNPKQPIVVAAVVAVVLVGAAAHWLARNGEDADVGHAPARPTAPPPESSLVYEDIGLGEPETAAAPLPLVSVDPGVPLEELTYEQILALWQDRSGASVARALAALFAMSDRDLAARLALEMVEASQAGRKRRALDALAKLDPQRAAEAAGELLYEPMASVRHDSIEMLGEIGNEDSIAALQYAFEDDSLHRGYREDVMIADAAQRLGDDSLMDQLVDDVTERAQSPDEVERAGAVDDASIVGVRDVCVAALADPAQRVRRRGIHCFAEIGTPEDLPILWEAAQDPNPIYKKDYDWVLPIILEAKED